MEKLNDYKYEVIQQLDKLGADDKYVMAVANAGSESEVNNIVAQWQRSDDYSKKVQDYADADASDVKAAVPRGYVNDDPGAKIRQDFAGMPRSSMRPALALYNNANGTNYTEPQVDSILSTPSDYGKQKVDDFVNQYKQERRVQDSIQNVLNYQNSWIGRNIKPVAQAVDGVAGFVPNPLGYIAAAVGPMMRAYDKYRQGHEVDPYNVAQDVMYNEMGQAIGGKVLKYGANLAQRMPYINRYAPQMIRASEAKKVDNAGFANPIIALQRRLEQLAASKAGKTPEQQHAINQEIVRIGEYARQIATRDAEPIYRRAIEEAKVYVGRGEGSFVRPFTTSEKVMATVDDGMTKYGLKKVPEAVSKAFGVGEGEAPIDRARESTRKAELPLLKYLIKLDSLKRLGYDNPDYEYVSRLLGLDSLPPNDRLRFAQEAINQDSLVGDWRSEYQR